jgi:hypothetical protein
MGGSDAEIAATNRDRTDRSHAAWHSSLPKGRVAAV